MFGPIISENDPPFFDPWVTLAHQSWKQSEAKQPLPGNKVCYRLEKSVWDIDALTRSQSYIIWASVHYRDHTSFFMH